MSAKTKLHQLAAPALLLAAITLTACSTPKSDADVSAAPVADAAQAKSALPELASDKRISLDPALNAALRPLVLQAEKPAEGKPLRVKLQLQNVADAVTYINYRVSWFDAQGAAPVDYVSSSRPAVLDVGETKIVILDAPTALVETSQVETFKISITEWRNEATAPTAPVVPTAPIAAQ